jgi:phosphatidylserine decarboxylase
MTIHKEGTGTLIIAFLFGAFITVGGYLIMPILLYPCLLIATALMVFFLYFFRKPVREAVIKDGYIISPADGKVVVIEETIETEYFNEKRLQVSVFMSPLNVHINWYPMSGTVKFFRYHAGKHLVAWHPKSSTDNERSTVVVDNGKTQVLFRQIAGAVARRVVCYAKENDKAAQGGEFGFIKFGSRVDIFLPLGTKVDVALGQKVQGRQTIIAKLP